MKISIVTVCYNAAAEIEETLRSVLSQTYKDIEYIVIDGGSTDGTIDIVQRYKKEFPLVFVTEKDRGVYDAMNKGVGLATGDFVNFMNAGDRFYSDTIVEKIAGELNANPVDIVYGASEINYGSFSIVQKERAPNKIWMQDSICHQSSFSRTSWCKKHPFDIGLKLAADLEFFLYCFKNGAIFRRTNTVIAVFKRGGLSDQLAKTSRREGKEAVARYYKNPFILFYCDLLSVKITLKKMTPRPIFKVLVRFKDYLRR
jgi:glycosyltransferase involved in cell wall biosynthesis